MTPFYDETRRIGWNEDGPYWYGTRPEDRLYEAIEGVAELLTTVAILEARLKEVEAERDRLQRLVAPEGPEFEAAVKRGADALDGGTYLERKDIAECVLRAALETGERDE